MHGVSINALLSQEQKSMCDLGAAQNQALCFIIDQTRQPEALAQLYGMAQPLEPTNLFTGTEFEALSEQGPIWLGDVTSPELKALALELCLEHNAGICVLAPDTPQALKHARWLLKANDGSGGQCLLSYYRAELWAALASTVKMEASQLMGPWSAVLSPAPKHLCGDKKRWINWNSSKGPTAPQRAEQFNLPPDCAEARHTFAWLYWVDEHFHHFGKPHGKRLEQIVANLFFLANYRITQGKHLLKLSQLICGSLLEQRPDVLGVLESNGATFMKVQQLQRLPIAGSSNATGAKDEWSHHETC